MVQVLLAAQHGRGEVLKLLAKAGADLDVRSSPAATHSHALCLLLWKALQKGGPLACLIEAPWLVNDGHGA
jgi:hypothetical protein